MQAEPMTCYISGPMRGRPRFNFGAFDSCALYMRRNGWTVFNPAEHDRSLYPDMEGWDGFAVGDPAQCPTFDLRGALKWDLHRVLETAAIILLPDWEESEGACLELQAAKAVGNEVLYSYPVHVDVGVYQDPQWFVSDEYFPVSA